MHGKELFHLGFEKEKGAKYAIITGDPFRVPYIAGFLEQSVQIAEKREYNTFCGYLNGERVLVVSHGIGGPSAAIAVEELCMAGVNTVIRVGTSGGIQLYVESGNIVIATAAVRQEGTSAEYAPLSIPAVADFNVVTALKNAGDKLNVRSHVGVIQSKDSFYGEMNPKGMPVKETLLNQWEALKQMNVLVSEMECAAIFTVAMYKQIRAGAVLTAIWNHERANAGLDNKQVHNNDHAINVAVEAMKALIEEDKNK